MFEFFCGLRGAPERKPGPVGLLALNLCGAARWGGRDTVALARAGVIQNAIAYACIRKIASAAASVLWLFYDGAAQCRRGLEQGAAGQFHPALRRTYI